MRTPRLLCTGTAWESCFSRMDSTSSRSVDRVKSIRYSLTERTGRVKTASSQTPVCNTTNIFGVNWASAAFNFTPKRTRTKEDLGKNFFLQFATREHWSTYGGQLQTVFCGSTSCFLSLTNNSTPEKRAGSFITQTTTSSQQRKKNKLQPQSGKWYEREWRLLKRKENRRKSVRPIKELQKLTAVPQLFHSSGLRET